MGQTFLCPWGVGKTCTECGESIVQGSYVSGGWRVFGINVVVGGGGVKFAPAHGDNFWNSRLKARVDGV